MAAGLAVLVGLVAVGAQRRGEWSKRFTTDLFGTGLKRVRGFLRPVDLPGIATARPCIGLENPGLEEVRLGVDAPLPAHAGDVQATFVGTKDSLPPTLVVEKGQVMVNGELVEKCRLADGDIIEVEGLKYQYLRGSRR